MNMNINKNTTNSPVTQEMYKIYYRMQRLYFENDFIERCIERRNEEIGLCVLPYDTLPDERTLLNLAYELYQDMEDSNIAYNATLDLVIDELELRIKNSSNPVNEIRSEAEK